MALIDNLVSYWSLDETSGTRVDSHGSNDLTDNNTVGSATGIISNGADFIDTNSEYLSLADSATVRYGAAQNLSFSFWFNTDSVSGVNSIIGRWANPAGQPQDYLVYLNGSTLNFLVTGASARTFSGVAINTWYHVVITMDTSGNIALIVNDGTPSTTTGATGNGSAGSALRLAQNQNTNYYDGTIDEVGFWNKILSAAEITDLYNSGSGRDYAYISGGGSSASSSPSPSVSASPSSSPSPSVSSSPSPSPSSSVSSSISSSPSPSPSPGSDWTLIDFIGASGTDSSVTTSTIDSTGANLIVVHVGCDAGATPTVSDSKGNTWTALTPVSSTVKSVLYYCFNPTVGTGHTFSQTTAFSYSSIEVQAWSHASASDFVVDDESGAASASVTTQQPGSITPTVDGALLVSGIGFTGTGNTVSINSSFTETNEVAFSSGVNYGSAIAYLVQSGAAAVNPTWTRTGTVAPLAATMMAFRPTGSSASSSPSPSVSASPSTSVSSSPSPSVSSSPSPSASSSPSPSVSASPSTSVSSSPSPSPSTSVSSSPSPSVSSSPSPSPSASSSPSSSPSDVSSVSSSPSPSASSSPSPSVSSSPSPSVSSSPSTSPSPSPSSSVSASSSSSPSSSPSQSPSSSESSSPSPSVSSSPSPSVSASPSSSPSPSASSSPSASPSTSPSPFIWIPVTRNSY